MTPNRSTGIKRSGLRGVNVGGTGETRSCSAVYSLELDVVVVVGLVVLMLV